jgi:hypothetical protein
MHPLPKVNESPLLSGLALDSGFSLLVYKVMSSTNHPKSSASANQILFVPFAAR